MVRIWIGSVVGFSLGMGIFLLVFKLYLSKRIARESFLAFAPRATKAEFERRWRHRTR